MNVRALSSTGLSCVNSCVFMTPQLCPRWYIYFLGTGLSVNIPVIFPNHCVRQSGMLHFSCHGVVAVSSKTRLPKTWLGHLCSCLGYPRHLVQWCQVLFLLALVPVTPSECCHHLEDGSLIQVWQMCFLFQHYLVFLESQKNIWVFCLGILLSF